MLHPGLNNLPLEAADRLPALEAVHAVEVYNHHLATLAVSDTANGAYMLDGLLEKDPRLLINAGTTHTSVTRKTASPANPLISRKPHSRRASSSLQDAQAAGSGVSGCSS
jgi:hypothetical protein